MAVGLQGTNGVSVLADSASNALRVALYDQNGNPLLSRNGVNLPTVVSGVPIGGMNDGASRILRLDRYGNARLGFDNLIFYDSMEGSTVNTQIWTAAVVTMTQAQLATTGINMNSGNSLAASVSSILTSQKQFFKSQQVPMRFRCRARVVPQNNAVAEFGWGVPTTNAAQIPVGACWRYTSGGSVVPVLQFNNTDVTQGTDISSLLNSANYYTWEIIVDDDNVLFVCQDVSTGRSISEQSLNIPISQARTWSVSHLPVFARLYTTASAPPSAPLLFFSECTVVSYDLYINKAWTHQIATVGKGQELVPTTYAQAANFTNSTVAANATLSNTAGGYTTLGGLYSFVAVAGAVTDYALFAFQVPSPYSFYCTGVHITAYNTGAAVATTPTLMHWGITTNTTAATLASNTFRTTLGAQYFPIGAGIGQCADKDIEAPFEVPLRTDAGKFISIILRMPVGTATASQVVQGSVTIRGYFE